ncbi:prolyl-tRNA synthetase associated domain-containing protein [Methylopila henanensis]|uniref:Prolyl-tRNA synthetase associated domain-containing protein n=1 Tax=Methylopila henanensis TaxID=873516 RepID=A0ABW4K8Q1_9HYPH
MPATRDELLARLAELGIASVTHDHEAVFTVAESRALKAGMPGGHTKNLFLKDRKGRLFLFTADAEATIDLKWLAAALGASGRFSFGSPELLVSVWGVEPGSVTPFGAINDAEGRVTVGLDASLLRHELVNVHPLTNTATTALAPDDLLRFLHATGHEPVIVELAPTEA